MRIISIINQKGGCGKTTTSINLAACMARLGQKTLLVDMDPQGHCGIGLAVPEEQIERSIYDALIEPTDGTPAKISEIVWQIASEFDLAPSTIRLAAFEQVFAGRDGREDRLRNALQQVSGTYSWVILDCPPSVGLLTFNALKASDEVIVPVETGFFSLHGLTKMMETLEMLKDRCNRDVLIRVLPTLYDTRTKLAREVLSELRQKFREFLMESTINFNTKLKEAASFGQPITEYDPGSRGYKDFVNLARELMGHRPVQLEQPAGQKLSRPAELVQRARQLAQLASHQFGRSVTPTTGAAEQQPNPLTVNLDGALKGPGQSMRTDLSLPSGIPAPLATKSATAAGGRLGVATAAAQPVKTTEQKIEEFYGARQVGHEVIFAAHFENAQRVQIAGDFNNWQPSTQMENENRPGDFRMRLPLQPGRYRYRFVVDGRWVTDPYNKHVELNQFGELDNIVEVA